MSPHRKLAQRQLVLLVGVLGALLSACMETKPATEIIVVIDSDIPYPTKLTEVDVFISPADHTTDDDPSRPFPLSREPHRDKYSLPLSFSVIPPKGEHDARIRFVVKGRDSTNNYFVEQQVIATFQTNKAVVLPIFLGGKCSQQLCVYERTRDGDVACDVSNGKCAPVPTPKLETAAPDDALAVASKHFPHGGSNPPGSGQTDEPTGGMGGSGGRGSSGTGAQGSVTAGTGGQSQTAGSSGGPPPVDDVMCGGDVCSPPKGRTACCLPNDKCGADQDGTCVASKCPAFDARESVIVEDDIAEDTTWSCDKIYDITDFVYVTDAAVLTIEPGTTIEGGYRSAIWVTRGAALKSEGTQNEPIVFTSLSKNGFRSPGDWGGVVLLGGASINAEAGESRLENVDLETDVDLYGGDDDDGSCGSLKYTRIEFTGLDVPTGEIMSGLVLAGCGSKTTLSHVQVHRGSGDGITVLGGTPHFDHVVLTGNRRDSFVAREGFQGDVQFLISQQLGPQARDGVVLDNQLAELAPRTEPKFYNVTLIGATRDSDGDGVGAGVVFADGAYGTIANAIVMGFPDTGADLRNAKTVIGTEASPPELVIEHSLFFENGDGGNMHFVDADDDDGFDKEQEFFGDEARANLVDKDPRLGDPRADTEPNFVPDSKSPAKGGVAPPEGFDTDADYMGALEPGGEDWTAGWTTYQAD